MDNDRFSGESAEHALRDLMGLLALPALWAGGDGKAIVGLMTQAIERIVPLDLCYVDVPLLPAAAPFVQMRLNGRDLTSDISVAWRESIVEWHRLPIGTKVNLCDTPAGPMRMIRLSMGFSSGQGSVWFGAAAANFPTLNEIAFLRAATSQAATGIQAARSAHEREEANRAKDEF